MLSVGDTILQTLQSGAGKTLGFETLETAFENFLTFSIDIEDIAYIGRSIPPIVRRLHCLTRFVRSGVNSTAVC